MRFETEPGEQAQVDYGQLRGWIGEQAETVHLFVFTLGYSRRLFTRGYQNERLATLLDRHERALSLFQACRATVSTIIHVTSFWAAVRARCCGTRYSKILPPTMGLRRAPASRIGHEPRGGRKWR